MKNHARRAIETLEALGFYNRANDYDRGRRMRLYTHPWHPDESPIRLYENGSEAACKAAERMAHTIVGLEHAAPKPALSVRDRYRLQRDREKREQQQRVAAELARAQRARSRMSKQQLEALEHANLTRDERQRLIREEQNHRYYAGLMQPGRVG